MLIYLGLGSNLGDRHAIFDQAIARLAESGAFRNLRQSSRYETEPWGFADQPLFLNMVVEVETDLRPRRILERIKRLERELGRKKTFRNGPRIIDIDLLLCGSEIVHNTRLEVPHPRMCERRFVLEPLLELAPQLVHPVTGKPFAESLAQLDL